MMVLDGMDREGRSAENRIKIGKGLVTRGEWEDILSGHHAPASFMTVRREIAVPRRESGARSLEDLGQPRQSQVPRSSGSANEKYSSIMRTTLWPQTSRPDIGDYSGTTHE